MQPRPRSQRTLLDRATGSDSAVDDAEGASLATSRLLLPSPSRSAGRREAALSESGAAHSNVAGDVDATGAAYTSAVVSSLWRLRGLARQNRNVTLTIVFNFVDGACYSVWGALLLPVLIGKLCGDAVVGVAAAAAGVAQLFAAGIAGYWGSRVQRQTFVRIGALCGLAGVVAFLLAVYMSMGVADSETGDDASSAVPHSSSSSSSGNDSGDGVHAGRGAQASHLSSSLSSASLSGWSLATFFIAAQAVWGTYTGLVSTSAEALFADSVPSGQRTGIFTVKWMVQTLCYVVGYLAALAMLLTMGNDWNLGNVQLVMSVGLVAHPLALAVLLLLKDSHALPAREEGGPPPRSTTLLVEEEEGGEADDGGCRARRERVDADEGETREVTEAPSGAEWSAIHGDAKEETGEDGSPAARESTSGHLSQRDEQARSLGEDTEATLSMQERVEREIHAQERRHRLALSSSPIRRCCQTACFTLCSWRAVPLLVCLVDFLMALGSGMTMLYFPLFFKNEVGLTPVLMYMTYLVSTCLTAATSHLARVLADRWLNRIPAVMLVRTVGSCFLLLLGIIPVHLPGSSNIDEARQTRPRPGAAPLFMALFILRNACMNAVMGMTRSVIMDAVTKESRAKWSAWESVSSFTWAGSSVVGGWLVERHGYQFNFTATAVFHLAAGLLLLPAAIGAHPIEVILKGGRDAH